MWGETGKLVGDGIGIDGSKPILASDSEGGFFVVWGEDWPRKLRAQRFDKDGNPLWPSLPNLGTGFYEHAEAIPDGTGGLVTANTVRRWSAYEGVNVHHVDKSGNVLWSRFIPKNSAGLANLFLTNDGRGGYIVAFEAAYWTTWVHRLDANGNELWPGGVNIQGAPHGLRGIAGGAIVMSLRYTCGYICTIEGQYVQKLDANGSPMWGPDGVKPFGGATSSDSVMIDDYSGGAIIALVGGNVVAQRIDKNGNILWPTPYIYVSNASGEKNYLRMTVDGEGGAVITWRDLRDLRIGPALYAQRVLPDGRLGGEIEGFLISGVLPNKGGNTGNVSVLMRGGGFQKDATVKLVGPGGEILGQNTSLLLLAIREI